jgi:hypothetical protein
VPNHPFSLQSLAAAKGSPPSSTDQPRNKKDQPGRSKPPLREQIAQQPPATPRRPLQTNPPAWISQLDTLEHDMVISKKARDERQEQALEEKARDEDSQLRELSPAASKDEKQQELVHDVDSLVETPTISSPSVPAGQPVQSPEVEPAAKKDDIPPPILGVQTPRFEEVTDLDTIPLSAQHQVGFTPAQSAGQVMQARPHPGDRAAQEAVHTPQYTSTPPASQPALRTAQEAPGSTPVLPPQHQVWGQQSPTPAFAPQARRSRRRVPVLVTLTLICLLVLGGVAAWILKFQPFSIPQVTQSQQQFQSSALGVSLSYPSGWSVQVDRKNGTAHFSDSSRTAQFSVTVVPANGQDAGQYLLKQATQLGLTGTKPGPQLSFGGSTWQQTQGAVQQAGANYTEVLLATTHGSQLVSIIQQAPQVIYADEEQAVFASVRSSFQFLS